MGISSVTVGAVLLWPGAVSEKHGSQGAGRARAGGRGAWLVPAAKESNTNKSSSTSQLGMYPASPEGG